MGIMRPQNDQMRLIALAVGGSVIAAAGTMFVPTSLLESITGATGLSELVPATAAPLGDTARALIAFAAGVVMLILLLAFLLRERASTASASSDQAENAVERDGASFAEENIAERFAGLKKRVASIRLPKMPWTRGEDDILDLADLPKLRGHDAHPDAPVRRPISALTDLAGADLTRPVDEPLAPDTAIETPPPVAQPLMVEPVIAEPTINAAIPQESDAEPVPTAAAAPAAEMPALETMVAELEAAVEQRKLQLAKLENTAEKMMADKAPPASPPPLEAVPVEPRAEDDEEMDAALNAALETLQRMNGARS